MEEEIKKIELFKQDKLKLKQHIRKIINLCDQNNDNLNQFITFIAQILLQSNEQETKVSEHWLQLHKQE